MTFVHTSCLEVDANSSQISLTDDGYIQYVAVDDDAKDSTEAKGNEVAKMGKPKVTLQRRLSRTSQRVTPRMVATPPLMTRMMVCSQMARVSNCPTVRDSKVGLMMKWRVMKWWQWPT